MKRLQNRIAESSLTLPVTIVYGLGIWLLGGLVNDRLWGQLACFIATVYLIVEFNNSNALLRVRSRMVSCVFIILSCAVCQLFASLSGGLMQACVAASLLMLFHTYHDRQAVGKIYYAFLFWSLASIPFVHILMLVPLLWLLMATNLQSLSFRSLSSSVLGLLTPYWFIAFWCVMQRDFSWFVDHFTALAQFRPIADISVMVPGIVAAFVLTVLLTALGISHLIRYGFEDKTRIRLTYGFLCILSLTCMVCLVLQPQHYDMLLRLVIILSSPVIAHFMTLTSSRLTNILFFVVSALAVAVTVVNLWHPTLTF